MGRAHKIKRGENEKINKGHDTALRRHTESEIKIQHANRRLRQTLKGNA